jgi:hypothetical protein
MNATCVQGFELRALKDASFTFRQNFGSLNHLAEHNLYRRDA